MLPAWLGLFVPLIDVCLAELATSGASNLAFIFAAGNSHSKPLAKDVEAAAGGERVASSIASFYLLRLACVSLPVWSSLPAFRSRVLAEAMTAVPALLRL